LFTKVCRPSGSIPSNPTGRPLSTATNVILWRPWPGFCFSVFFFLRDLYSAVFNFSDPRQGWGDWILHFCKKFSARLPEKKRDPPGHEYNRDPIRTFFREIFGGPAPDFQGGPVGQREYQGLFAGPAKGHGQNCNLFIPLAVLFARNHTPLSRLFYLDCEGGLPGEPFCSRPISGFACRMNLAGPRHQVALPSNCELSVTAPNFCSIGRGTLRSGIFRGKELWFRIGLVQVEKCWLSVRCGFA